jgi:cell division protein FtsB
VYIAVVEVPPSNLRYEYSAERHQYEPFYDGFISRFVASPPLPLGTTLNVRTGIITGELFREEDVGNFTIVGHGFESTVAAVVRIDRVAVPDPAEVEDQLIYHSYSMRVANNTAVFNAPLRAPPCTFALDQNTPASLLPSGVTFETTSGTFRGTPVAPMARQLFVVRCSSRAARVFLQVFEEPRISMARYSFSLTKGEKANGLEISVTGMQSISSVTAVPRLPLGLDFNSSGQGTVEIAGTPQQVAAETTYDVIVRSALGAVARQQVILKVSENPPQAVGITNAIRSLQVGRYEEFYPAAWDSSISIGRFSIAPDPPAGMSFSDGKLFGAPTALLRAIPFTITASNSGGARSVSFFLEVTADGSAEAVRITEEVPRSGDSLPVTAAVMSLLILVLFFVVVYMLFLAWRARRRRTIAEKARETLEARIARYKAKKREEELAALEAALRAKQAEEARLRAIEEAKRKPKPLSEIGEVPDRIVDLFAKLGLKPAHAENLIRENVGVLDLPHLRTEELNALVPNAKARAKLLHYIKDVLVPYIAPPEARGWFTGEAPRSSSAEWQQAAQ